MNKLVSIGDMAFTINCMKCTSADVSMETRSFPDKSVKATFICYGCGNSFDILLPHFEEAEYIASVKDKEETDD